MLASLGVLVVIFCAILTLVPTAFREATGAQERTFTILDTKQAVERIVRELRTANLIGTPTSQVLHFDTPTLSIMIECTNGGGGGGAGAGQGGGVCNRREAPLGQNPANNPANAVASNVLNTDVFGVSQGGPPSNRDYVCVKIVMGVPGSTAPVTIQDGVALRNNQAPSAVTPPCGAG